MSGKTFVLVHGAFAGQYAWSLVKPLLESAGNTVATLDLPAHGEDATPTTSATFESYQNAVIDLIHSFAHPVILVGHSMAGLVISQVAERIPDQIEKLIYLSAYLPKDGQSLQELAMQDGESLIGPNLQFAPDYSGASLPVEIAVQVFAGDCSDEIKKLVSAKSKREPLAAFQAKVSLSDTNFGRVPKYYIETLKDLGVGNILQKRMVAENGTVRATYSIDSSHSPYFAKPEELTQILQNI